jgi:hypothetical protein
LSNIGTALWISGASASPSDFRDYASLIIRDHLRFFQQLNTPAFSGFRPALSSDSGTAFFTPLLRTSAISPYGKKFFFIGVLIDRLGSGIDTKKRTFISFRSKHQGRYPLPAFAGTQRHGLYCTIVRWPGPIIRFTTSIQRFVFARRPFMNGMAGPSGFWDFFLLFL